MSHFQLRSPAEQIAAHLREELFKKRWSKTMPGTPALATELGVDRKAVSAALELLTEEGLLVRQGPGKGRRVNLEEHQITHSEQRIAILPFDESTCQFEFVVEMRHRLMEAGHAPFYPSKTLTDLGMDVKRIARLVQRTDADAWIVIAASSAVLSWFEKQKFPSFAFCGFLPSFKGGATGPKKSLAYKTAVQSLVALGHHRIVLVARPHRKYPVPGVSEQSFLDALSDEGIKVSDYHFPEWEANTSNGFHRALESLFHVTPPTALIVQETLLFAAVQQFLAKRGLRVPEDISLICTDQDPNFEWCATSIARFSWQTMPMLRRTVNWANNVGRKKIDQRHRYIEATFVNGGTVGPAPTGTTARADHH